MNIAHLHKQSTHTHTYCMHVLLFPEFDRDDHHKQNEEIRVEGNKQVHCLRLLVTSGYDHFVAVYNVKVNGRG